MISLRPNDERLITEWFFSLRTSKASVRAQRSFSLTKYRRQICDSTCNTDECLRWTKNTNDDRNLISFRFDFFLLPSICATRYWVRAARCVHCEPFLGSAFYLPSFVIYCSMQTFSNAHGRLQMRKCERVRSERVCVRVLQLDECVSFGPVTASVAFYNRLRLHTKFRRQPVMFAYPILWRWWANDNLQRKIQIEKKNVR